METDNNLKKYFTENKNIVIAIDGPAGSGKSTIASRLAKKFGLKHFSMGNTFRTIAFSMREREIAVSDYPRIENFITHSKLTFDGEHILIDGRFYCKEELASMSNDAAVIASDSRLHSIVSTKVRKVVYGQNIVVDGRAMGSRVFPDAKVKIFLDASLDVRAKRRQFEDGEKTYEDIKKELEERDNRDCNREYAPLVCNEQYRNIDSSNCSIDDVSENIEEYLYLKLIISELYNEEQIIRLIEEILVTDDEKNVYKKIDFIEDLITLLMCKYKFHRQIYLKKRIRLDILNVMCTTKWKDDRTWFNILKFFPDISSLAREYGLSIYDIKSNIDPKLDLYNNEILKMKRLLSASQDTNYVEKTFADEGEIVVLIKPSFSQYEETVKEIIKRILQHNCDISKIRIMNGKYFREHQDKVFYFYEEAYEGYKSGEVEKKLLEHIQKKYDNSFFEFIFEEKYNDSMVITAGTLIDKYNVSPSAIDELWQFGRENITKDQLIKYLSLSNLQIKDEEILFEKGEKKYILKNTFLDNGKIKWFHNDLCFGVNKVCRSRSAFCVQDARIRDGQTTIIVNGHFQGLLEMFSKNEERLVIALKLSLRSDSSSMHMLRKCLAGNNSNPEKCLPGSIRRDGYEGVLSCEWDCSNRKILNGLYNIVHMSNGLLEGMKEATIIFDENVMNQSLAKRLLKNGCLEKDILYLLNNPLNEITKKSIFELTANLDEEDLQQQVYEFMQNYNPAIEKNKQIK